MEKIDSQMLLTGMAGVYTVKVSRTKRARGVWERVQSPERFANPNADNAYLDVDGDGRLTMQDYNIWARTDKWQTCYVAPGSAGSAQGDGTFDAPFILADGNELTFNQLIRPYYAANKHV